MSSLPSAPTVAETSTLPVTTPIEATVPVDSAAPAPEGLSPRREIARIAVPVSFEFVLTLVLNFVNQIVVGTLGATAIAAVGFANSLTMILVLTLGAIGASVSILVARAFGAGRRDELDQTVSVAMVLAVSVGVLAAVPVALWPHQLLELTGASDTVAAAAAPYLALVALSLPLTLVGAMLSGVLRSMGRPRSPMVATFLTVGVNGLLGYSLVMGLGPFPELGIAGAGVATLVTTGIKAAILGAQVYVLHRLVGWSVPRGLAGWRTVAAALFVLALPLGLTELFWTSGTFLYNVVFSKLGDAALAAAQIVNTLESVFIVGSIGLMSATTALIGREVGRGDGAAAAAWVRRIKKAGTLTGVVFGALYGASALLLATLFPEAGDQVRLMAVVGIVLYAVSQVVKVRNMILGAGVLPSANDVRGVILGDASGAFLVGLPLAVVLGLFTPLGVAGVFLARVLEELAKVGIFSARTRKVSWHALAARDA